MSQENIWVNISRQISGEGTEEDSLQIEKWLNEKRSNRKIFVRLQQIWQYNQFKDESYSSLYDSVKRKIAVTENKPQSRILRFHTRLKVAAMIAVILLSNFLIYNYSHKAETELLTWHEIVVPRGNRMKLVLPDSSSVWLNNETRFRYASNFSSGNRQVELSGEAYFNVHHDDKHPFIVKVGEQKIRVLGTKFSVNAYPEDKLIETSLIEGSVSFESKRKINGSSQFKLEPGYSLYYDKTNNSLTTQKIQSSYYQYWENGVYAFKEESFENLAIKIKRIFNIEVKFEDDILRKKTYTGTININDNIFIFMEALRRTSVEPIEYKHNKNTIYVKLRN